MWTTASPAPWVDLFSPVSLGPEWGRNAPAVKFQQVPTKLAQPSVNQIRLFSSLANCSLEVSHGAMVMKETAAQQAGGISQDKALTAPAAPDDPQPWATQC